MKDAEPPWPVTTRGVVVLDEGLDHLAPALRGRNIYVVVRPSDLTHEAALSELLPGRVLVTNKPADYVDDASSFTIGIVGIDQLSHVDDSPDPVRNVTAKLISDALVKHALFSRRHAFVVTLHAEGTTGFKMLID